MTKDTTAALLAQVEKYLATVKDADWSVTEGVSFIRVDDGRAHVCHISNHQSGQRGAMVADFIAAAPSLVRDLRTALVALQGAQQEKQPCLFRDGRCTVCGEPESGMCNSGGPPDHLPEDAHETRKEE